MKDLTKALDELIGVSPESALAHTRGFRNGLTAGTNHGIIAAEAYLESAAGQLVRAGLSQQRVGTALGVSQSKISRIVAGN